jgi:hypothetical protein
MDAYHALLEKTGGAAPSEIGASRTKGGTVNALAVAANAQKNSLKAIRFLSRFAISKGELAHDPIEEIEVLKADGPKSKGPSRPARIRCSRLR